MVHYRTTVRDFQIICIVFPSKSQCICYNCTTADEEIRNSGCHDSLSGDWQWQMIPSSFPKVWRILDVFLPLFCFPKQEGESLRFFWGLGRGKKCWDAEVRSGPVAISREKKTHLFSSFSLCRSKTRRSWANSFRVSHQQRHSWDHHQSEFQDLKFMGICQDEKKWGSCQKKMY